MSEFMFPWIIAVVIVLIGIVVAFMVIRKNIDRNTKLLLLGVIVGVVLLVLLTEIFIYSGPSRKDSEDDDSFPISIWIVLWCAIVIPILAKKKKKPTPEEKKRAMIAVLIGIVALLVGITAFVLVS